MTDESSLKSDIVKEQGKLEVCEREVVVIRRALEESTKATSAQQPSMSSQELKVLLDTKLQEISASKVLIGRMKKTLGSQLYRTPTGAAALEPSISPVKNRLSNDIPLLTPAANKDVYVVSNSTKQMLELTDRIEKLSNRLVTSEKEKAVAVDQLKLAKEKILYLESLPKSSNTAANPSLNSLITELQKDLESNKKELTIAYQTIDTLSKVQVEHEQQKLQLAGELQHNKELFGEVERSHEEIKQLKNDIKILSHDLRDSVKHKEPSDSISSSSNRVETSTATTTDSALSYDNMELLLKYNKASEEKDRLQSELDDAFEAMTSTTAKNMQLKEEVESLRMLLNEYESKPKVSQHDSSAEVVPAPSYNGEIHNLDRLIHEKQVEYVQLTTSFNDARRQYSEEFEQLSKELEAKQNQVSVAETELASTKLLVETAKVDLKELLASNETELKNSKSMRSRCSDLKQEVDNLNAMYLHSKEVLLLEESKLRNTKSVATEQLRLIQMDVGNIESEVKQKKHLLMELEKKYQQVVEDRELKKRELEHEVSLVQHNLELEKAVMHTLKKDIQFHRGEAEALQNEKKSLENSLNNLNEQLILMNSKLINDEMQHKKVLLGYDKQVSEYDRKVRACKEKVKTLEGEQTLLHHSVEELRHQQSDLERTIDARRKSVEDELATAQNQSQLALRASRMTAASVDLKKAELEGVSNEVKVSERKVQELQQVIRSNEILIEEASNTLKSLLNEQESTKKEISASRREASELQHQLLMVKAMIDNDNKSHEECKRRLNYLLEEEVALKESETRLKSTLLTLKKSLDDSQSDLEATRNSNERERRTLSDMRTKRSVLETDISRLNDEHKFILESINDENKRKMEAELSMQRVREEYHRQHKELSVLQRKVTDILREEESYQVKAAETKLYIENARLELENVLVNVQENKQKVERLKNEQKEAVSEIKKYKEDNRALTHEHAVVYAEVEKLKSQCQYLEETKELLQQDIERLRETAKMEINRIERMEVTYSDSEKRIKSLRDELTATEQSLQRLKDLNVDEEKRVNEQRKLLKLTMEELSAIESTIAESNRLHMEQRCKVLNEIGQLNKVKADTQSHVFMVSEGQRRMAANTSDRTAVVPPTVVLPTAASVDESKGVNIVKKIVADVRAETSRQFNASQSASNEENIGLNELNSHVQALKQQSSAVLAKVVAGGM